MKDRILPFAQKGPTMCSLKEWMAGETKSWRLKKSYFIYLYTNIYNCNILYIMYSLYMWHNKLICKCLFINYISYVHRYKAQINIHPKERKLRGHRDEHTYFRVCLSEGSYICPELPEVKLGTVICNLVGGFQLTMRKFFFRFR